MTSLSKFKNYYIDVLVSAAIFGAMHVLQHGWITTDFILYFVMGLIFCMMFRYTRSIYWTIALHASWNTFLLIVSLLVFWILEKVIYEKDNLTLLLFCSHFTCHCLPVLQWSGLNNDLLLVYLNLAIIFRI